VQEKIGAEDPKDANYLETLGQAHASLGMGLSFVDEIAEAEGQFRWALEILEKLVAENGQNSVYRTELAWLLANCPAIRLRNPLRAVGLMTKVIEQMSEDGDCWKTLGVAQFRAGNHNAAVESLNKAVEFRKNTDQDSWFFLAMAHARLGNEAKARTCFEQVNQWMDKNQPKNEELRRLRDEAARLMK
jgi:uncharacterized protein HemY